MVEIATRRDINFTPPYLSRIDVSKRRNMQDQRSSARRELSLDARIKATSTWVKIDLPGEIVNMSSCGALIAVPSDVPRGTAVEIRADWPAVREDSRGSLLVILGRVVRTQPGFVAVEFGKYAIRPLEAARRKLKTGHQGEGFISPRYRDRKSA